MSKVLEILNKIKRNGGTDYIINWRDVEIIAKALTPPTADEVCEALSKYWGNPVQYDERHDLFEMYVGDNTWKPIELLRMRIGKPHLITLIGRFYQGLEESKNV